MNTLRFLICSGRQGGCQRISTREMTTTDNLFNCYSYVCKDKAEYDKLSKDYVAKANKRFWGEVDVYNTVTGQRSKVTDIIGVLLKTEVAAASTSQGLDDSQPQCAAAGGAIPPPDPITQTPGGSQSGGEQSPAEPEGTFSDYIAAHAVSPTAPDFAAELAANAAADIADESLAAQEQTAEETPAPAKTAPAKPASAAKKKK